ncbi:hypothetical protein [Limnohabitans sp. 2KL-51]|uniref:hypothetical protein n=1 Tax=Limnohabitans sp. 2KL-51 TaxID=1977911 RepID=UPI000D366828|nr:hypothetical protein [Limnohabitans sp. 2KL-51]PUE51340.1 hypothetical protein B9Z49_04520 [Limnohabitans sp. 2KL-51]
MTDSNPVQPDSDEFEIDFVALLDWLLANGMRLAMGAAGGLVLAVLVSMGFVNYQSKMVLINQGAINFTEWKSLSKLLPALATQTIEAGAIAEADLAQVRAMRSEPWWTKNVVPTYSLSKADTKELASMSKQMTEAGGDTILNFVVSASASNKTEVEKNVAAAVRFMQQGVAFMSLQNFVNSYEVQVLNADSDLRKRVTQANIELKYLQERARNLERLRERFPGNTAVANQQVVDLQDSNAKFMPISTQLVAVQSDINALQESLVRLQDQQVRQKVMADFVGQALPLMAKDFNGLTLVDQLLKIEQDLRAKADAQDINQQQALNNIQAQLVSTKTFFSKGLEVRLAPTTTKTTGVVKPALVGLFLGLLGMLGFLLLPKLRERLQR